MLDLNDFRYFVGVVDAGGLTAASRTMNVPKSTLSHRLQQLEAGLGVRLVNRTSRSQSMTDAGTQFYRHAVDMLSHADLAENGVRQRLVEPTGVIRFTTGVAPSLFAMRQIVPAFARDHPKVRLEQHTSDDQIDIVGGGFDLAIRSHSGALSDSSLVQRVLAQAPWSLFASPAYIGARGLPNAPDDLANHDTLAMLRPGHATVWKLSHAELGERIVPVTPRFTGNDLLMLKQCAQDGIGVVALPGWICRAEERGGTLVRVMPDWIAGKATISAVVPIRDGVLPAVRLFLDHLSREFPKIVNA
ncbi:LysR substrate-binding domain-containing protein [Sphingomonas echinoides]|uniref:LysR substrate-binding domain-containing protein n=1 Tax=Sphingomonas echinoides TaxID=59803 RepID=UPI0024136B69|nr:LysR substrate-binding domain-containing protein [Sphingomonas echinoides]